jgi:hypothetical protein
MTRTEITPTAGPDEQVTVGDRVFISWLLDAEVNPADVVLSVLGKKQRTISGADLTVEEVTRDDDRYWQYGATVRLDQIFVDVEFRLKDSINKVVDTAFIQSERDLT